MKKYTKLDILMAREERVNFQDKLREKYNLPMISLRVNFPGVNKDNLLSRNIAEVVKNKLVLNLNKHMIYEYFRNTAEGPVLTLVLNSNAKEIKKITIDIEENHMLGRCVDIDVYDKFGMGISRVSLGYGPRKCFLCKAEAKYCVRSRKHSIEEIIEFIQTKYNSFIQHISK